VEIAPYRVPVDVAANVAQRWPSRGSEWFSRVELELPDLCARYDATPRRVLPARYGFVVAADTSYGGLVFRASPGPEAVAQARVAQVLGSLDVGPTVHEIIALTDYTWTVMDEVRPGTPLPQVDPTTVSVEALAEPLAAMVGRPPPAPGMPSIFGWLRAPGGRPSRRPRPGDDSRACRSAEGRAPDAGRPCPGRYAPACATPTYLRGTSSLTAKAAGNSSTHAACPAKPPTTSRRLVSRFPANHPHSQRSGDLLTLPVPTRVARLPSLLSLA
jgi:hypothetical protein